MAGLLSIITPVYGHSVEHLAGAYASVADQQMPVGWEWEWLVQEDGETGAVAARTPNDSRIHGGAGRHGGPAMARNLALGRSRGDLIKVLDADDQLLPGALARDIDALSQSPNAGWTTSRALDLMPDGTTAEHDTEPDSGAGPLDRGTVLDFWLANDYRLPIHPATLCMRRELITMLGGWMALPASEDTGLLLAASVISDGYFIGEVGLLYRKWDGQATGQPGHTDPIERATRMSLIRERALALRGLVA